MSFVHLRNHTVYSLLEGMGQPKDYIDLAKKFDQPAIAITDSGNLFASYIFWKECMAQKIKPILGIEFFVSESDNMEAQDSNKQLRITVLAKNQIGWLNMMRLSTLSYKKGRYYKPRIDTKHLFQYADGLIVLSAGLNGIFGSLFKIGNEMGALSLLKKFREVFKDDFYLEVSPFSFYEQVEMNKFYLNISKVDGFQIVATNNCRYPLAQSGQFFEYLLLIKDKITINDGRHKEIPSEYYFKTRHEMFDSFKDQGFNDILINSWLDRTIAIAEKIENLEFKIDFKLPKFSSNHIEVVVPSGGLASGFTGVDDDEEEFDFFAKER